MGNIIFQEVFSRRLHISRSEVWQGEILNFLYQGRISELMKTISKKYISDFSLIILHNSTQKMSIIKCVVFEKILPERWCYPCRTITWRPEGKALIFKILKTRTKNMSVINSPSYDATPVKRWESANVSSLRNSFLKIDITHMVWLRDVQKGKPVLTKLLRPGQKTCLLSLHHHMM